MSALCYVREGMFVSGFGDKSQIIWSKLPDGSTPSPYSHNYILTRHKSNIMGITRMSNTDIISGGVGRRFKDMEHRSGQMN